MRQLIQRIKGGETLIGEQRRCSMSMVGAMAPAVRRIRSMFYHLAAFCVVYNVLGIGKGGSVDAHWLLRCYKLVCSYHVTRRNIVAHINEIRYFRQFRSSYGLLMCEIVIALGIAIFVLRSDCA